MSLTTEQIREILAIVEASGWDEAEITIGDTRIHVSRDGGAPLPTGVHAPARPAPAPAPALTPAPPSAVHAAVAVAASSTGNGAVVEGVTVTSPLLGMFWRAPEPGAAPFVDVGSIVAVGDTLCIVEVMKLMNHVPAETAGTVVAVHATNGDMVEAGAPLFTIAPA